ncbi:ErfK/YbiS/YcfS/YnhG family protein [Thiorhodococcus drewsii AZ1]|uniref:ErfK/YbiS/YcfS/YnhG family protein n=1 Tax=Thiorhodococcus drewsii AZ1 TaxID=765913 RepID=G2E5L5_9GAMM|nr:L,D-transpeptidase [Thiorhodococcus drewsii]EGV28684.1 ErfK/YbiS/YcfS/YnhG family protein [Thiorhodococcus drewsii AZ1]
MNDRTQTLSLALGALKITFGAVLLVNLSGCDGLAKMMAKPEPKPDTAQSGQPEPLPPLPPTKEKPEPKLKKTELYEWNGEGRQVTRIVVNTNEQKATFYSGNDEVGWSTVATGVSKHPTPTGNFEVIEKVENKRSNLYGKVYGSGGKVIRSNVKVGRDPIPSGARFEGAKMPYFMRLTNDGVGLHAGPIPRPGRAASHGCIRMPSKLAPVLFAHVPNGTPVTIEGKGPSYGDYMEKQRAIAAKQRAAEQRRLAAKQAAQEREAAAAAKAATAEVKDASASPGTPASEPRETKIRTEPAPAPATETMTADSAETPRAPETPKVTDTPVVTQPATATPPAQPVTPQLPKPEQATTTPPPEPVTTTPEVVSPPQQQPTPSTPPEAPSEPAPANAATSPTPPEAPQPEQPKPEVKSDQPAAEPSAPAPTAAPAPTEPPAAAPEQPPAAEQQEG